MKHPSEPCRQGAEKGYRVPAQTVINLRPMRLSRRPEPFDSDEYLFELKIDGFRALAHIADGKGELVSRNGNVFRGFADLATWIAEHLKVEDAVLMARLRALMEKADPSSKICSSESLHYIRCIRLAVLER
jgi:hypothetical protein